MSDPLSSAASHLWQPWIAIALVVLGLVLTLATGVIQLRGLASALKDFARNPGDASRWTILAVGSGAGGLGAGVLALQWGGRGAIVWMWIAMFLAMAIRYAQGVLAFGPQTDGRAVVVRAHGALAGAAAVATLGVFGGQQLSALLAAAWGTDPIAAALVFAAVAIAAVMLPAVQRIFGLLVPLALVAWTVVAIVAIAQDDLVLSLAIGDAYNEAFGLQPVITGAIVGSAVHAFTEGMLAAGLATSLGHTAGDAKGARTSMLAPLCGIGLVGSLGALVGTTAPASVELATGDAVPLERHHSRGLRPSQQVGQTVVMPLDTTLEPNKTYGFIIRSNPRGSALGRLDSKNNAVLLPAFETTKDAHEVVFRMNDKDPAAKLGSWDVRVPCNREILPGRGGPDVLKLTPVNPELELKKLITYYELSASPHVPTSDFSFVGKVGTAQSNDEKLGQHLAMFELEGADRAPNPKLHEFFRVGYRGPYADTATERAPWGFVAPPEYAGEIGSIVQLRLPASPRGEPFIRLNRTGGAEAPPWDLLRGARQLVVRHKTDPTQDIVLGVETKLDGFRMRFTATDPEWADFRKLAKMPDYEPVPFVRVRDLDFTAEVHGDARLAPELKGRRTIVPIHALVEPQGPYGEYLPYVPHPIELVQAGMSKPILARDGAAVITGRFVEGGHGWAAHTTALAMFVLGIAGIVGASRAFMQSTNGARILGVILALGAVWGTTLPWIRTQGIAGLATGAAFAAFVVLAVLGLGHVRKASRDPEA
jgi:hypothetical protein